MKTIPHIDISDEAQIQALLADPRCYSWRAVDSETLDTWTPDLGLTAYPRPSVYRAGAVARSGMASTLRHRFWQTIERQADHTGRRYIGILIYLAAGESSIMDLRLASQDIGRIKPGEHDNRLHLIVADSPVDFIGEMEIFQLTAPGRGSYRIERIALLPEKPQPRPKAPAIGAPRLRLEAGARGRWTAHLHCVAPPASRLGVRVSDRAGGSAFTQTSEGGALRRLSVADLPAGREFEAVLSAVDSAGRRSQREISFSTVPPAAAPAREVIVPLEILSPPDANCSGLPLRFGLPLAAGAVPSVQSCALRAGGQTLPATIDALSRWRDGSIRWALVAAQCPASAANAPKSAASLHINGAALPLQNSAAADDITLSWHNGAPCISGGGVSFSLADMQFEALLGAGSRLSAGAPRLAESRGKTAMTIDIDHCDGQGVAHLRSRLWLRAYPGQTFVTLRHRLEVISPALAPAAAGDAHGEESTLLALRSFALRIPFAGGECLHHSGESWRLADGAGWQLRHDHDLAHEINGIPREGRAAGHIRVAAADGSQLGIGLRHFWQSYPKALAADAGGIDICLFPERAGRALPGDDDAAHRLYTWLDAEGYRLKAGMALGSEILLDFGGGSPAAFAWLEAPPLVRPDIDAVKGSGALNPIGARRDSPLPKYEALTDRGIESFLADRERFRAYGQVNFGDWYGESGWSWGNNEYDPAYCGYTEFLRGGNPRWAQWAAAAARHLADVDTSNFSAAPSEIGGQSMHMPGHLGGYLPPYFRSKMGGTKSIPSHTWVEGPLLHYLLTGDQAVYDSLLKTRGWLLQGKFFDYYDFSNAREAGWHLIHLCAFAAAFDDADCLNAADIIVERVLQRQAPAGGWERNLTESHCGCGYPRCRGEAGFMVGVLISGLKRYHNLTAAEPVAAAIAGGARWLIRRTFDAASGHFRYTSCPNRTLGGTYQHSQYVLEALAAAWELSGDREIGRALGAVLPTIGMFPAGLDHLGLGKALSQQMRYVPTIQAILEKRPLEDCDD